MCLFPSPNKSLIIPYFFSVSPIASVSFRIFARGRDPLVPLRARVPDVSHVHRQPRVQFYCWSHRERLLRERHHQSWRRRRPHRCASRSGSLHYQLVRSCRRKVAKTDKECWRGWLATEASFNGGWPAVKTVTAMAEWTYEV